MNYIDKESPVLPNIRSQSWCPAIASPSIIRPSPECTCPPVVDPTIASEKPTLVPENSGALAEAGGSSAKTPLLKKAQKPRKGGRGATVGFAGPPVETLRRQQYRQKQPHPRHLMQQQQQQRLLQQQLQHQHQHHVGFPPPEPELNPPHHGVASWRCWRWCGLNTGLLRSVFMAGMIHFFLLLTCFAGGFSLWLQGKSALYGLAVLFGLAGLPGTVGLFIAIGRRQRHFLLPFLVFLGLSLIVLVIFLLMSVSVIVELATGKVTKNTAETFGLDPSAASTGDQIVQAAFWSMLLGGALAFEIWSLVVVRQCYNVYKNASATAEVVSPMLQQHGKYDSMQKTNSNHAPRPALSGSRNSGVVWTNANASNSHQSVQLYQAANF